MLFVVTYVYQIIKGLYLHFVFAEWFFFVLCVICECFGFFSFHFRACEALQQCLHDQLRDATFAACLQEDKSTKHWLSLLIKNVDTYSINPRQVGISPLTS